MDLKCLSYAETLLFGKNLSLYYLLKNLVDFFNIDYPSTNFILLLYVHWYGWKGKISKETWVHPSINQVRLFHYSFTVWYQGVVDQTIYCIPAKRTIIKQMTTNIIDIIDTVSSSQKYFQSIRSPLIICLLFPIAFNTR